MKRILLLLFICVNLCITVSAKGEFASLQCEILEDRVVFTVYITESQEVRGIAVVPEFDAEKFTLTEGQWALDGALMDFNLEEGNGVIGFTDARTVDGAIFTFTLTGAEEADHQAVRCKIVISKTNGEQITLVAGDRLEENQCDHSFTVKNTDASYLASDATCTTPAEYRYSCICGALGTQTFTEVEPLEHQWSDRYTHTGFGHSRGCVREGCSAVTAEEPHSWDKGTVTNDVKTYLCQICGRERTEKLPTIRPTQTTQATTSQRPTSEDSKDSDGGIWVVVPIAAVCVIAIAAILKKSIRKEKNEL